MDNYRLQQELLALNRITAFLLQEINQIRGEMNLRAPQAAKRFEAVDMAIRHQADRLQALQSLGGDIDAHG